MTKTKYVIFRHPQFSGLEQDVSDALNDPEKHWKLEGGVTTVRDNYNILWYMQAMTETYQHPRGVVSVVIPVQ